LWINTVVTAWFLSIIQHMRIAGDADVGKVNDRDAATSAHRIPVWTYDL
jgi:hypothetical protein